MTYSVRYKCHNCGWSGRISFKKGKEAPSKTMCPNCDCWSAKKIWDQAPVTPLPKPVPRPEPLEPSPYIPWPMPFPQEPRRPEPWDPWKKIFCRYVDEED